MSCSISILSISGIGQPTNGTFQNVTVDINVTGCTQITLTVSDLTGNTLVSQGPMAPTSQVSFFGGRMKCGNDYVVRVECSAGGDCFDEKTLFLPCDGEDQCCPELTIIPTIGDCNPDGSVDVSFEVTGNASPDCVPHSFELDFGGGNTSSGQAVFTAGPFSLLYNENFPNAQGQTVSVSVLDILNPSCPERKIEFVLPDCAANCCLNDVNVGVTIGDCVEDCKRTVTLTTNFVTPSGNCDPATMQWSIYDNNGNLVETPPSFVSPTGSPNITTIELSSSGNPYKAILSTTWPEGCDPVEIEFNVEPCEGDQKCPENVSLEITEAGCRKNDAGKCCRVVNIKLITDHFASCSDSNAETRFEIFFNSTNIHSIGFGGNGTGAYQSFEILVENGGTYDVSAVVTAPTGCSVAIHEQVDISSCSKDECETDPTDPSKPVIPCILCVKCSDFLTKIGAGKWKQILCKALIALFAVTMAITLANIASCITLTAGPPGGGFNLSGLLYGLNVVLWIVGWIVLRNYCGECCLWCAVIAGVILSIIAIIAVGITVSGSTWPCILNALFWTFVIFITNYTTAKPRCNKSLL